MKSTKSKLLIGLVCLVLGFILSVQIRSTFNDRIVNKSRKFENLSSDLDSLKKQKADELNKLQKTKALVNSYEKNVVLNTTSAKKLKDKIDLLRLLSGYEDVQGEGITIAITPVEDIQTGDTYRIVSGDLVDLINELNSGGAEAISINDERYTGRTQIMNFKNDYIKINDTIFSVGKTFTIKAIGNPDILSSTLNLPESDIKLIIASGLQVHIKSSSNIKILKYNGIIPNRFIK